ncbi:hypothetical protein COCNU_06G012130 [Cocos nucifera]|uniref:Uncharacterized protein n=1 Tax=Cocos nucifera TaxID=13894 RepID=A0A8K0IBW7_COCNU|nr:hypothetical protein COCNU_06G012130 [Cocos nucifera]
MKKMDLAATSFFRCGNRGPWDLTAKQGEPSIWVAAAAAAFIVVWGEEGGERRGIGILRVDRGDRALILESRSRARAPGLRHEDILNVAPQGCQEEAGFRTRRTFSGSIEEIEDGIPSSGEEKAVAQMHPKIILEGVTSKSLLDEDELKGDEEAGIEEDHPSSS